MPPITRMTLSDSLKSIGVADVLFNEEGIAGDPAKWVHLGSFEGDRAFERTIARNSLTAPEQTGDEIPHQTTMNLASARITGTIIAGDPALWAKIDPFGIAGGGFSSFRTPNEVAVVLLPHSDIEDGLWNTTGDTTGWGKKVGTTTLSGANAAPKNAIWFPRAVISSESVPFSFGNGGKSLVPVTIEAMFYASAPEGFKVYAIGDPNRLEVSYGVEMGAAPA